MFSDFITLSTKPYEIKMEGFSQEVEEELPKKGQLVYGLNAGECLWRYGYFVKINENGTYKLSPSKGTNNGLDFSKITTKNPYEVEEDREPQIGDMVYAWDDSEFCFIHGKLYMISIGNYPFAIRSDGVNYVFKNCSLKNPLEK